MDKELYSVIFLLSDVICFGSLLWLRRYEHRLRRAMIHLLSISCLTITLYTFTLICGTDEGMKIAYCAYFASMDWLCAALFSFVAQFTRVGYQTKLKKVILPILIADSLSLLFNIHWNHVLDFVKVMRGGERYLSFIPKWPFNVHLTICYTFIIGILVILCKCIVIEPRINKVQYATIFTILFLIVIVNAAFLFTNLGLDVSIVVYGFGAVLISYYTVFFLPKYLLSKMSAILLNSYQSAVVLFDENGVIIYENAETNNWEGEKGTDKESIFKVLKIFRENEMESFQEERTFHTSKGKRILKINYSPLTETNKKGVERFIGSYLVMEDISEQIRRMEEREYHVTHDDLTGIYNRSYFFEQVPILLEQNPTTRFSVFMSNIYQFKLYNEVFGFEAGNELLCNVAEMFRQSIHNPLVIYARYDADRFVVCMPTEICTPENFEKHRVTELTGIEDYKIFNYVGVYNIPAKRTKSIAVICERAAIALNTVKGDAARRWAFYDAFMREQLFRGKDIVNSFENALKNGEITIYVQPQINQITKEIVGGEVLARWITSEGKSISPGEFIPVLESHGLITELDNYVWECAFKLAKSMEEQGMPISLSVNISTQDLYRCDIYKVFTGLSEKYNLPEQYMKLEITESNIMNDMENQIVLIKRLQERGFKIEMDDFGSGYSSLNSLKDIPIDVLKMDFKFLEKAENIKKSQGIIKTIIMLGDTLGVPVIAEGVENQEQADFLKEHGCSFIQGFLFGRPMPTEAFIAMRRELKCRDICQYTDNCLNS